MGQFPLCAHAASAVAVEDATWCLVSSFQKALVKVEQSRVPSSSNDDTNDPYSALSSPVTAA